MLAQAHSYQGEAGDETAKLRQFLPLVKRAVNQLRSHCGSHLDPQDMEQIGMMALLDSLRRYPGELDGGFINFASKRIRGAILDELRRLDWRPRPVRQQAHEFNDVVRRLSRELGRPPRDSEVAEAMGLTPEQLRERLYASQAESMQSLDELFQNGIEADGTPDGQKRFIDKRTLVKALGKLNKREQLVLGLYYQHELNLKEIALTLNLTESRVCQLHKAAVKQLRAILSTWQAQMEGHRE
ncbi:RNA polymerase sigma factor FliA [Ferrimonas sediminicola]|uniref:RNA polymerase sigma factor FliA n=1 Tax=Ferrimonas sediminicola TaxID=2569538 RepID=A0A4U1BB67_9GAMM|nr:RNA polymerase sigma factor FliA [Ferrimonas sediminicola]TKB47809.1 RNA polymerase sigma factor FliA [Ferrimonas sediminicola]